MMCKWRSPTIRKGPVSRSSAGPRVVLCNWRGRRALLGGSETRFTSCSALPCLASRHREHNVAPHCAPEPHPDPRSVRGPHTHFNLQPPPGVGDGEYCLRPPAPQQPFQTAPLRHPSLSCLGLSPALQACVLSYFLNNVCPSCPTLCFPRLMA